MRITERARRIEPFYVMEVAKAATALAPELAREGRRAVDRGEGEGDRGSAGIGADLGHGDRRGHHAIGRGGGDGEVTCAHLHLEEAALGVLEAALEAAGDARQQHALPDRAHHHGLGVRAALQRAQGGDGAQELAVEREGLAQFEVLVRPEGAAGEREVARELAGQRAALDLHHDALVGVTAAFGEAQLAVVALEIAGAGRRLRCARAAAPGEPSDEDQGERLHGQGSTSSTQVKLSMYPSSVTVSPVGSTTGGRVTLITPLLTSSNSLSAT